MQVIVFIVWGALGAFGFFHHAPKPTTDYRFTTAATCPFYRDVNGQTQVEPFVICPDAEDQKLAAEWVRCGEGCSEDGTAGLPVVNDADLVEVAQ